MVAWPVILNRKALHDYTILERYVGGPGAYGAGG
ncbi:MAG: hypothetical protein KatS3mg026_0467 [Bacteroidia bacterium]|nr:MAG: hypothetical protein KatS3mg026_0467 [Bacteroidia bacterium]